MNNLKIILLPMSLALLLGFSSCTKDDVPAATVVNSKVFV